MKFEKGDKVILHNATGKIPDLKEAEVYRRVQIVESVVPGDQGDDDIRLMGVPYGVKASSMEKFDGRKHPACPVCRKYMVKMKSRNGGKLHVTEDMRGVTKRFDSDIEWWTCPCRNMNVYISKEEIT